MTEKTVPCPKLLDIAKDEWMAFKEYMELPDPFPQFAVDELKHFSHVMLMLMDKCPVEHKQMEKVLKEHSPSK